MKQTAKKCNENKAYIKILKNKTNTKGICFPLQFNPTQYTIENSNNYDTKDKKGKKLQTFQFKGSQQSDMSLELLFDSTDEGKDVRERIKPLDHIYAIDREKHAPPPCMFVWGRINIIAVISKITKKFTYFYSDGIPARVRITLTLKPYQTTIEAEKKNQNRSADLTKMRITEEGDNIWLMADREYDDPKLWRVIAHINEIDDPRKIENGRELRLPPRIDHE